MERLTGKAFQRWGKYLSRDVDAKVEAAMDSGTAGRPTCKGSEVRSTQ